MPYFPEILNGKIPCFPEILAGQRVTVRIFYSAGTGEIGFILKFAAKEEDMVYYGDEVIRFDWAMKRLLRQKAGLRPFATSRGI